MATVVRISGEARYSLGDGNWHPLVAGKILAAGSVLQTGPDATVDIVLGKKILMPQADPVPNRISEAADSDVRGFVSYKPSAEQNTVRMTGDTVLAIDKLTVSDTGVDSVSDTELDLRQGGIYNSVKKLSGASQYLIKIPNGIAGVRGTLFYIAPPANAPRSKIPWCFPSSARMASRIPWWWVKATSLIPKPARPAPLPPGLITELDQIFLGAAHDVFGNC